MPSSRSILPALTPALVVRIVIAVVAVCLVGGILLGPLCGTPRTAPTSAASSKLSETVPLGEGTTPQSAPESSPQADGTAELTSRGVDCSVAACVALTFDDGPGRFTGRLLDSLKASDTKATFFVLGRSVTTYPAVVRRAAREGHVIASHGWDHKQFTGLSASGQRSQLTRTASALATIGVPRSTLFRPPYGSYNGATRKLGVPIILWNVDPRDWKDRSVSTVTSRVLSQVKPGSVVLLHDVHATTVDAVPGIIRQLRARGYTLVSVPELFGSLQPGQVYSGR